MVAKYTMVNSCANCTISVVKCSTIKFHRFLLDNKELCWKGVVTTKRGKFTYLVIFLFTPADSV